MDETPVLARHPLHTVHKSKPKLPLADPITTSGKDNHDVSDSEDSETEGENEEEGEVELIEGEREGTGKADGSAWQEEQEDLPSTQVLDPRPLAGTLPSYRCLSRLVTHTHTLLWILFTVYRFVCIC